MSEPITEIKGLCQWGGGCTKPATKIACGNAYDDTPTVRVYCEKHAKLIVDARYPEYVVDCPNCKCSFGVN